MKNGGNFTNHQKSKNDNTSITTSPNNSQRDAMKFDIWESLKLPHKFYYWNRLLHHYRIQLIVDSSKFGVYAELGARFPKYYFIINDLLLNESTWWYYLLTILNERRKISRLVYVPFVGKRLLAWIVVGASQTLSLIKEIFEDKVYDVPGKYDILFDIGAHMGVWTIRAAINDPDAQIYSIEPDPELIEILKMNLEVNEVSNVNIIRKAVWSSCTTLKFCRYHSHTTNRVSNIRKNDIKEFDQGKLRLKSIINIKGETIDAIIDRERLNRIDFIKMDIEGAEVEAIRGATSTLTNYRPILAIAAYHKIPPNNIKSYKILKPMLTSLGYRVFIKKFPTGTVYLYGL